MTKAIKISDYHKIKKNIDEFGYVIIKDVYKKRDLENLKKRLLEVLHYIHPKKINDLNKKYFQVKKFDKKLKGNFFDMLQHEQTVLKLLYDERIINIVRKYFKSKVVFRVDHQYIYMTQMGIDFLSHTKKQINLQEIFCLFGLRYLTQMLIKEV